MKLSFMSKALVSAILVIALHATGYSQTTLPAGTQPGDSFELPRNILDDTNKILDLSQSAYGTEAGVSYEESNAHRSIFRSKIDELFKALDHDAGDALAQKISDQGSPGVNEELILIARDITRHPEHCADLVKTYSYVNPKSHSQMPLPVRRAHATEDYRLAWEYMLLTPRTDDEQRFVMRSFEALSIIRSSKSISVLLHVYEQANRELALHEGTESSVNDQRSVIDTLAEFKDANALRALLKCMHLSAKLDKPAMYDRFTMKEWIERAIRCRNGWEPGFVETWQTVIHQVLDEKTPEKQAQKISEDDRTFLKSLLVEIGHLPSDARR